jgi:peptidoglycan hydrolase-like protein with peptidoglycan-binding domain
VVSSLGLRSKCISRLRRPDLQATLQQEGYYRGEVDGMLGPLTRSALANYQRNNGLYITSAIDRPTLESLGIT